MANYLTTPDDVRNFTREVSKQVDDKRIYAYIRESENIDIKNALGDAFFIDLKENQEKYELLLKGGVYETDCGEKKVFSGIKAALNYYTYARIVKNGDWNVTRYGFVSKESEYSSRPDLKEKITAYNDAFSIADQYLKECVKYLQDNNIKYPLYKGNGKVKANRVKYKILGE